MNVTKAIQLAKLVPTHPVEAWDRVATVLEVKRDRNDMQPGDYEPIAWESLLHELDRVDPDSSSYAEELALRAIESEIAERQRARADETPFDTSHDGDLWLGRLCYIVARATRPKTVVETGVAYGVTSACILQALAVNKYGQLHSIDLPPLAANADQHVGALIPDELKDRWHLHRGPSKRLLAPLLETLGSVDLFVHDSLHTYKTMRWEFETVTRHLSPGAVLIADDVGDNRAFAEWSADRSGRLAATLKEITKDSMLGVFVGEN